MNWWSKTENVAALYTWMCERNHNSAPFGSREVERFLHAPHKWDRAWCEMQTEAAQSFAVKDGAP